MVHKIARTHLKKYIFPLFVLHWFRIETIHNPKVYSAHGKYKETYTLVAI
jgi:hypothetical protein